MLINIVKEDEVELALEVDALKHLNELAWHVENGVTCLVNCTASDTQHDFKEQKENALKKPQKFSFRYAPSLVTRSESELFNISNPRFSFRLVLTNEDDDISGFLNIRRLRISRNSLGSQYPSGEIDWEIFRSHPEAHNKHLPGVTVYSGDDPKNPAETFETKRCVADSLLTLPHSLKQTGFYVLEVELGRAYGEGRQIFGTPFVEHIVLGGGLCAQAACMMCTMLLESFSSGIHGVAEVTVLSVGDEFCEFQLTGLNPQAMMQYFGKVNLNSILEGMLIFDSNIRSLEAASKSKHTEDDKTAEFHTQLSELRTQDERLFIEAIYAYVKSGFPVILLVDVNFLAKSRLSGFKGKRSDFPGIYERNAVDCELPEGAKPLRHAVVVVGASEKIEKEEHLRASTLPHFQSYEFLINDPLQLPFMVASGRQIYESRTRPQENISQYDNHNGKFLSVLPSEVRLPLVGGQNSKNKYIEGVLPLSYVIHFEFEEKLYLCLSLPIPSARVVHFPGTVRLVNINRSKVKIQGDFDSSINNLLNECVEQYSLPEQWIWVQYYRYDEKDTGKKCETLWIWDAQKKSNNELVSTPEGIIAEFILAIFFKQDGKWKMIFNNSVSHFLKSMSHPLRLDGENKFGDTVDGTEGPDTEMKKACFKDVPPSIISSFSALGFQDSLTYWPTYNIGGSDELNSFPCELYCMMTQDTKEGGVFYVENTDSWENAVDFMSEYYDNLEQIKCFAKNIQNSIVNNGDVNKFKITSFASFIAEITCSPNPYHQENPWEKAYKSIAFMINLARALKNENSNHEITTIELVAGSRIGGVWLGNSLDTLGTEDKEYFASHISESTGYTRLLDCLYKALEITQPHNNHPVYLSLEVEPGPLYLLKNQQSMSAFLTAMENHNLIQPYKKFIGFNLDISHWRMANISSELFLSTLNGTYHGDLKEEISSISEHIFHAHVSGHHPSAHTGDSPLGSAGYELDYSIVNWFSVIDKINQTRLTECSSKPQISISLELEASKRSKFIQDSMDCLYP